MEELVRFVREHKGVELPELDYSALHQCLVRDVQGFWSAAEFLGVIFRGPPTGVLESREMPGAQWFRVRG